MACLFKMACQLSFCVRAPLSDGAHLVCGQVLAAPPVAGTLCRAGPESVGAGLGVFAHGRDPSCPASAAGHGAVDYEHDDGTQDREEPGPQVEEVAEASAEDQ